MKQYKTIDEYIKACPKGTQEKLQELRQTIRKAAPEAQEKISYGLATFTLNGSLVHFGGYDTHIGFYPGSSGVEAFKEELKAYDTSRGTVRFLIDKPLPLDLICQVVEYRVKQNETKKR